MLIACKMRSPIRNVALPWFGTNKERVKEAEAAGVKSVPALVMNGAALRINFGAGIDALK
jgi:hypothetical protein